MARRRHRTPNRAATRAGQHTLSTPQGAVPAPRRAGEAPQPAPATQPPVAEVGLDRLGELVGQEQRLKEELAELVDRLAAAGVGWPQLAAVLGISRQAARQAHRRRHANVQREPAQPPGARVDP